MNKIFIFIIIALVIAGAIYMISKNMTGNTISQQTKVEIKTTEGDIILELYPDKAPVTVENFLVYVNEKAYDNTIFHRVIADFMIQGGGFTEDGEEKPTHSPIKLESDNGLKNNRGTIAMARTMIPDSATNQFFINLVNNDFLNYGERDEGYAVFGKVIKGMDVVDKIGAEKTDSTDKPVKDIKILSVKVA